tara:strand:+ start:666 stop:1304 length:639 start_codon:yes stop_codon:yes gene_type:complete
MDGNNRWSKKNSISKYESYKKGAEKLIEVSNFIFNNYNINYVSAFALSKHNFKRGSVLIDIIKNVLIDFLEPSNETNNFKFRVLFKGNLNFLPSKIVERLKKFQNNNLKSKKTLIIYLNYSGKEDITNALKTLSLSNNLNIKNLDNHLSSAGIKDPDILIRTGGFQRISDFMLYQISFTELFFTSKLWPSIKNKDITKFIEKFNKIDRKFGN